MKAAQPVVEVTNLTTRFGTSVVHQDITLTVNRGEVLALVGGSGSGKSTLLREILLLHRPTAGVIRIFGKDPRRLSNKEMENIRCRMGVLFQHSALFSSCSLLENVLFPLQEHTQLPAGLRQEIAFLKIGLVGLPREAIYRYPSELSGGMRKRAALARALALDPELLFLDEPTSGLDPVGARDFDHLLLELHRALGLTVLMVTHDLDSLRQVADRVAVLGRGRLLAVGTIEEAAASSDPLVRALLLGRRGERPWKPK